MFVGEDLHSMFLFVDLGKAFVFCVPNRCLTRSQFPAVDLITAVYICVDLEFLGLVFLGEGLSVFLC